MYGLSHTQTDSSAKSTYPSLIGLDESKKVATDLIKEAKDSIRKISEESRFLEDLADYIISRDH